MAAIFMVAMTSLAKDSAPTLRFDNEGKFKIVQFTDTHIKWGNSNSDVAFECIDNVIDAEQPQLVIFTGDQIYAPGAKEALTALATSVSNKGIPFAAIFGNHDHEFDLSYPEMYDLLESFELSVMPQRPDSIESPDYALEILSAVSDRPAYVLYCMDTHHHNPYGAGYDWLKPYQVDWYQTISDAYAEENAGYRMPALLFIHIPLPEYTLAIDQKTPFVGTKKEKICSSAMNSGMFLAMHEKGDVAAVFCGHDHDNDFATMFHDILLAYGRYTGGNTVYNHLKPNGARVIVIDQRNPKDIETWVRLNDGSMINYLNTAK